MEKFLVEKANEFAKIIYDHPGKFRLVGEAKQRLLETTEIYGDSNKAYYLTSLKTKMQNMFLKHLQDCPQKEKCAKRIAFTNVNFLIAQEIISLDSFLKNVANHLDDEDFEKYYDQRLEKRADQAGFFLDMIIEKKLINLDKPSIRKYFMKWFKDTQEFDLQIENGDFVIEDGDLQMIPDFSKDNIPQFLKWFENEGNKFIDYLKTQGVNVKDNSKEAIINTGNLIINEN